MIFNKHSSLEGKHAFLSPSNYHWLRYDTKKLEARYESYRAARRGVDLHGLAHECIRLGVRLSAKEKALRQYVADGIGYKMQCEQPVFYSVNCFGTADTLSYRRGKLRIHDLKTGATPTSFQQLEVYAAIFCLEYGIDPTSIEIELRIYQREEVRIEEPTGDRILDVMDTIVRHDIHIEQLKTLDD